MNRPRHLTGRLGSTQVGSGGVLNLTGWVGSGRVGSEVTLTRPAPREISRPVKIPGKFKGVALLWAKRT